LSKTRYKGGDVYWYDNDVKSSRYEYIQNELVLDVLFFDAANDNPEFIKITDKNYIEKYLLY